MSTDLSAFKGNSLVSGDLFKRMMEINKTLSGSGSGTTRRISIKGGRFREMLNGEQVRVNSSGSMNVVVLGSSKILRTYYEGAYDPEKTSAPTCWSVDTEKPAPEVAEENLKARACRDCPMNIKGSGQGDSRACRFSQRLAVALENDYDKVYQLQLPATSLFGEAKDGKMGMQAYSRFLSANDMPIVGLVTQVYFDENSETPKLYFKPQRPLENDELHSVFDLVEHEDVKKATTLTVYKKDEDDTDGATSKSYNPKKDKIEVAPAAKASKASKPKEVSEEPDDVMEPTRVASKSAVEPTASPKMESVLSAWDD
jgi:hypothetical protein